MLIKSFDVCFIEKILTNILLLVQTILDIKDIKEIDGSKLWTQGVSLISKKYVLLQTMHINCFEISTI